MKYGAIIFLVALVMAPQLWWDPILNWRVDFFIYPLWAGLIVISRSQSRFRWEPQDWFVVGAFFWFFVSIVLNHTSLAGQQKIEEYFKMFLVYILTALTVRSVKDVRSLTNAFLIMALLLTIEGIQHKLSPTGLGWAGQERGWIDPAVLAAGGVGRTRWVGIFDGPGVFAVIYTIALPFLLLRLFKPFRFPVRIGALVATGAMLVAIFFNGSRGGLLATMGIFAMVFFLRYRIRLRVLAPLALAGLIVMSAAPSYLTNMHDESNSSAHRIDMWAEGLEMVQSNPVYGIGRGNFLDYTSMLIAHNSGVEIMGETGLIGLFFWIGISYMALKNLWRIVKWAPPSKNRSLAAALGIAIIGYHISAFFVTLEYQTFYFLLALARSNSISPSLRSTFGRQDLINVASLTMAFPMLTYAVITVYKFTG